jgi:hypothetical protein
MPELVDRGGGFQSALFEGGLDRVEALFDLGDAGMRVRRRGRHGGSPRGGCGHCAEVA